ncbi:glycosyltransferase involved in cell wall biosynthesis [Hydrogenivirga caldilitoris]|uniref:Glycosyltransferase involved in cell wall biosynthesis n=1 Tax=Hydrogenivirga caldilitoris TaxID=246264 RepID=A0A497XR60_9AQUI|nr:glycosyltransferase [Hydrogenivirga caldilitoris]RLJ71507.1 glycosyltransferase involved in cell wall biosynthesis [Hydrogenivirga caldilitoris]
MGAEDKIIIYLPTPLPGGAFNSAMLLAEGLSREGFKVKFVANRKGKMELPSDTVYLNAGDFIRPFKLKTIIEQEKPLAVFSNMLPQNVTLSISKLLLPKNLSSTIKFIGFSRNSSSRIRRGQWYKLPYRLFIKKLYENLDYIIAVSDSVKIDLMKAFFIKEEKIKVIHNPLKHTEIFKKKREPLEKVYEDFFSKGKIIINTSRFAKQKRLDLLIKAFKKISKVREDVRLVLVGSGEEENNLRKLVENLGLKDKVLFIPFSPNPFKYIHRADVFVLTSQDEGFGRVVMESLACGTPVVAYKNEFCDHSSIITDGYNGFQVPFGDEDALVDKVLIYLSKDKKKVACNCVLSTKKFSLRRITCKILELI